MSHNPYDPYASAPRPGGGAPGPAEPPQPLRVAVLLMYVGAGLAVLSVLSTFFMLDDIRADAEDLVREGDLTVDPDSIVNLALGIGVGVGIVTVALWVWMAVMNSRGRGWARIVATVLGALSLCSLASLGQPGATAFATVLSLLNIVLAAAILIMLWQPASSEYYRARSARR